MASLKKLLALAATPAAWPALTKGVAPTIEHRQALGRFKFNTVIDIGANKGQFASFAAATWPGARIFCFEPLPAPRAKLGAVLGARATVFDCALGGENGSAPMHVASREDSSSMLPLGDRQKEVFSMEAKEIVQVPIKRLDDVMATQAVTGPLLVKIDVQGFERDVLAGGADVLAKADAVYIELSFVELYSGQALAGDIVDMLGKSGLAMAGLFNQMYDRNGDALQADFLFLKRR
jgi:FkbM family methyltransferase